jgi:putative membrane protein
MNLLSKIVVWFVAVEHIYIMILECFFVNTDYGRKTFKIEPNELTSKLESLFFNQGFYNLFLAAGLIWALVFIKDLNMSKSVQYFFLGCVVVAGIVGSFSIMKIFFIQSVPALLGILFLYLKKDDI